MRLIRAILDRPVSAVLIVLSVVIFGITSIVGMQMEYFPDLDMPMEVVIVVYPGADADSVENLVVEPIEDIGKTLAGIESIESDSKENFGTVQFTYEYGTDLDDAYMELKAALDNLAGDLPEECESPKIMEINVSSDATISIAAKSADGSVILDYINDTVVPGLEGINGVAQVNVNGNREKFAKIVLDEERLRQYGISLSQVAQEIAAADFDMPAGTITTGSQKVAVTAYSEIEWHSMLQNIAIQTGRGSLVNLSDITSVINLFESDPESMSRFNGQDSLLIDIDKKSTSPTIQVCSDVEKKLEELQDPSIKYEIISSSADNITDTLMEVLKTLLEGVFITMAVLLVFLGDIRASLIVGSSMPLSLFMALIVLNLLNVPFDLMTGTGMIIAIGMLVDNSIVVLESCFRMKEHNDSFKEAAIEGAAGMIMSVFGSTLTTIVVYAPISMANGMSGQMNKPLCYAVMFTMIASLINSVTVVPLMYSFVKPKFKEELPINKILAFPGRGYRKIMPSLLRHPFLPVFAAVIMLVCAIGLASQLNLDIFPPSYDGSISIKADFRSGTKLEAMDEMIKPIEEELLADKEFESVELAIEKGTATITAYSSDNCTRSSEEAVDHYSSRFSDVTGMDLNITPTGVTTGLASLMSSGNTKTITIESEDRDDLELGAEAVVQCMKTVPGVLKVDNSLSKSQTNARFRIDQQFARQAGMQPSQIASQIYFMLNGIDSTDVKIGDKEYTIHVQYEDDAYNNPDILLAQSITSSSGRRIPLKDICEIEYKEIKQNIHRIDDKFTAEITATTTSRGKYRTGAAIDSAMSELELPEGVGFTVSTVDKTLAKEMNTMGTALITAVFLVFLVMAIQFESVKYSLMIMMCIPFSLIGSFGLMYAMDEKISMMAMMGLLMLVGMVVNNGILLVDGTNELKKSMPLHEALMESGLTRLRPILMTTLTTVLSMLPLLLSGNSGMNMMHGMGVVIVGGLIASTVLAMFLMPPFYVVMSGKKERLLVRQGLSTGCIGTESDDKAEELDGGIEDEEAEDEEPEDSEPGDEAGDEEVADSEAGVIEDRNEI